MSNLRRFAPAIVAGVALLAVGIANIDVKPTKTITVPSDKVKIIERVKVKVVKVREKLSPPDGYMSRDDCSTVAEGTPFRDVLYRFGWPAADDGEDSYAGYLRYPLSDDHKKFCVLDFWRGKLDSKSVDL